MDYKLIILIIVLAIAIVGGAIGLSACMLASRVDQASNDG